MTLESGRQQIAPRMRYQQSDSLQQPLCVYTLATVHSNGVNRSPGAVRSNQVAVLA